MSSKFGSLIDRIRRSAGFPSRDDRRQGAPEDFRQTPEFQSLDAMTRPKHTVRPLLVAASNSLGLDLHKKLARETPNTNLLVSPVSVYLAMAMASIGAGGETLTEIARALWVNTIPENEWAEVFAELVPTLRYSAIGQELRLANSVWVKDGRRLRPDYEQALKQCFEAEITSLPFSDPRSVERINRWVTKKTGGKIREIVGSLSKDERLMILNCVYFQGGWHEPFDVKLTRDEIFHGKGGDYRRPFMHMRSDFAYGESEHFKVVRLDYAGACSLGMWVFLPSRDMGLEEFVNGLDNKFWEYASTQCRARPGTLALPRFKLECSKELSGSLRDAGIERCFDPDRADFSGMLAESEPLFLSSVLQKTYLNVNEQGSEAAAATAMRMLFGGFEELEPPPPFEMSVDRPFFVAVGDTATGLLLFTTSVWEV